MVSNTEDQRPKAPKQAGWRAWLAWVALAGIVMWLFVAGLPAWYARVGSACAAPDCIFFQLPQESTRELAEIGIPLWFYAGYMGALLVLGALAFLITSVVIFLRRSNSRMALFVAFMLALGPTTLFFTVPEAVAAATPVWHVPVRLLHAAGIWSLLVFGYTFPDGRFVPGWTRYLAVLAAAVLVIVSLFNSLSALVAPTTPEGRWLAFTLFAWVGSSGAFQIYRYRREANALERQQMKWVAVGFTLFLAVGVSFVLFFILSPEVSPPGLLNGLYYLLGGTIIISILILFVISFAVAMLRHRLWDIDLIIQRTLVYTALTAALTAVYLGSVVLLQGLFRPLVGEESQAAMVLSTLLIAALFAPLRRRVQAAIDRRFYRGKYDAAKTLAAFGATVRDEVDLEALTRALLATVEETMQPANVSLWLAPAEEQGSGDEDRRLGAGEPGSWGGRVPGSWGAGVRRSGSHKLGSSSGER